MFSYEIINKFKNWYYGIDNLKKMTNKKFIKNYIEKENYFNYSTFNKNNFLVK